MFYAYGVTLRPTRCEEDHIMRQPEFQPLDSAVIPRFAEPATFMRAPYVHRIGKFILRRS